MLESNSDLMPAQHLCGLSRILASRCPPHEPVPGNTQVLDTCIARRASKQRAKAAADAAAEAATPVKPSPRKGIPPTQLKPARTLKPAAPRPPSKLHPATTASASQRGGDEAGAKMRGASHSAHRGGTRGPHSGEEGSSSGASSFHSASEDEEVFGSGGGGCGSSSSGGSKGRRGGAWARGALGMLRPGEGGGCLLPLLLALN